MNPTPTDLESFTTIPARPGPGHPGFDDGARRADPVQHSAFYRFVAVSQPQELVDWLRTWCRRASPSLLGSIVVAAEGISGAVSASAADLDRFERGLVSDPRWHATLSGLVFQRSGCHPSGSDRSAADTELTGRVPYGRLKIALKPEIVAFGVLGVTGLPEPGDARSSHLDPASWRTLLEQADPVLIDNRNGFEYRLGHFRGAIDPGVENFRQFAAYVQSQAPAWRASGRPVAMYCTGGIRCEKAAGWMQGLGLPVFQLQGGILNFLRTVADPERDWQGECFVFDQRIALDHLLQPTRTSAEQVYRPDRPSEAWRLARARRLAAGPGW